MDYLASIFRSAVPALIFWAILIISVHRDRSRYRNCSFLTLAVLFTLPVLTTAAGPFGRPLSLVLLLLLALAILLVPLILIANGIIMIRREGHSFHNLLSLLLGVMILGGELSTGMFFLAAASEYTKQENFLVTIAINAPQLLVFISLSVFYFSVSFLSFLFYSLFLEIIPRKRDFDYIIIHGAGLLKGNRISKLLSERLDKAIAVYQKDPTPPIMIPSGGKGSDESISEAEAMAEYLREHGIPEEQILMEDTSKNTMENLINSRELIEARPGNHYTALVTSNYHVFRALRYCRAIGFSCTGIGAHVAAYYWPSALIREYVAIHSRGKQLILLLGIYFLLIVLPMLAISFF